MDFNNLFKLIFNPSETDFIDAINIVEAIHKDKQTLVAKEDIEPPCLSLDTLLDEWGGDSLHDIGDMEIHAFNYDFIHIGMIHYTILTASATILNTIEDVLEGDCPIHSSVIGGAVDASLVLTAEERQPHEAIIMECHKAGVDLKKIIERVEFNHKYTLSLLPQWQGVINNLKDMYEQV